MRIFTAILLNCFLLTNGGRLTKDELKFYRNSMKTEGSCVPPDELRRTSFGSVRSVQFKMLWPGGVVPYIINKVFGARYVNRIENAMKEIERRSCIKFRKLTPEQASSVDHVEIQSLSGRNGGCWSYAGKMSMRNQPLNLELSNCLKHKIILHELMHVLGFHHEQNRYDRDQHVKINWNNIIPLPDARSQFNKQSKLDTKTYGTPYDYCSIMHYRSYAASKNGKPTIVQLNTTGQCVIGTATNLSQLDIVELNRAYQCSNITTPTTTSTAATFTTTSSSTTSTTTSSDENCFDKALGCEKYNNEEFLKRKFLERFCPIGLNRFCRKTCGYC